MKISFDFDGTLTQDFVKVLCKNLVEEGHDVWITISRTILHLYGYNVAMHEDVFFTARVVGIPKEKIYFTQRRFKAKYLEENKFHIHIDNDEYGIYFLLNI